MKRSLIAAAGLVVLCSVVSAPANPGKPTFSPAIYADGQAWGTKGTTDLPDPNEHNMQSFDAIVVIINGATEQLPVAEAAPRNPAYNGGRWIAFTAVWTQDGIDAHPGGLPVLMWYSDVLAMMNAGYIEAELGHPEPGHATYFQCPLLPVK